MSQFDRLSRTRNHFELFGLPVRFTLDRQFLDSRYLELTRETHPDFAGADADAQMAAMQLSARVNEAYATLSDELKRAEYMLQLRGQKVGDVRLSAETMAQVFELREQISMAQTAGDEEGLKTAGAQASAWLEEVLGQLAARLDAGEGGDDVGQLVGTARYLRKMVEC